MRELAIRSLVAVLGIPLLLAASVFGSWMLMILIAVLQMIAVFEWIPLCAHRDSHPNIPALMVAAFSVNFFVISSGGKWGTVFLPGAIGLMLLVELIRSGRQPLRNLGGAALFLIYISVPISLWVHLTQPELSRRFQPINALVILLIGTWICDTAAYLIGRSFGRHKLYPAASPGKTVEGFLGGLLFTVPMIPLAEYAGWMTPAWTDYLAFPIIIGVIGQLGDLFESLIKREAGVKDTSHLLPGHGGILDRFDSLLLATPFLFSYLVFTAR